MSALERDVMRQSVAGLGAVALAAGLLLSGCGTAGGVSSTPDAAAGASKGPEKSSAKVGDTITMKGQLAAGSQAAVVVKKVVDPAKGTSGFSPAAGNRYVAVQFEINNTGTAPYEDAPSNGAKVADADGQQFPSAIMVTTSAGPAFPAMVKLTPGGKALGYLVFEVPTKSKVAKVQFGMDSGLSDSGEWLVK
jgi:Domain of unknown function (DUF4352)